MREAMMAPSCHIPPKASQKARSKLCPLTTQLSQPCMPNWILSSSYKVIPSAWKIPHGRLLSSSLKREARGSKQL